MLGRTIERVRAFHGTHLHPTRDDRGAWRYQRSEVELLAARLRTRKVTRRRRLSRGELAQRCFALLDVGASLKDIVRQLPVTPEQVRQWHREWCADFDQDVPLVDPGLLELERLRLERVREQREMLDLRLRDARRRAAAAS